MPRYQVEIKRQKEGRGSTTSTRITVEAENEINARFAAESIAKSRWPDCIIMVCQVRKQ